MCLICRGDWCDRFVNSYSCGFFMKLFLFPSHDDQDNRNDDYNYDEKNNEEDVSLSGGAFVSVFNAF